ncbi:MAG: 3-keto-5-aminohexanoate cleavage protein [Spirochaetales bacterium]|nr:3-keto-5-aminohexanoate cleavage protein [Spirochaetales bacterium]
MNKILLSVAPVAKYEIPGARLPKTPEEIAAETVACAQAGAAMVHLHVRDEQGEACGTLEAYSRTLDLIRRESEIVIQGSTGGFAELSLEERCVALKEPRTQVASLNMGSTNYKDLVYINAMDDIRYWARRMKEENVIPEMEFFPRG